MTRLRVVRPSADPPPLELPRAQLQVPWWDSVWFGFAITGSLLCGVVLMCLALGWIRL